MEKELMNGNGHSFKKPFPNGQKIEAIKNDFNWITSRQNR